MERQQARVVRGEGDILETVQMSFKYRPLNQLESGG